MYTYSIELGYSEQDEGYIAVVPELAGCSSFGETEAGALSDAITAISLWLQTAKNEGREIPRPEGRELLRAILAEKTILCPARSQKIVA